MWLLKKKSNLLPVLIACFSGFVLTWYVLRILNFNYDKAIFYSINHLSSGSLWVDVAILIIAGLGGGYLAPLIVIFFALFYRKRYYRETSLLLAISMFVSLFLASLIKPLYAYPRPYFVLDEVDLHSLRSIFKSLPRSYGFPSSYTIEAFSNALVLGLRHKKWMIPLSVLAFFTALAMIYLGVHFPSDITAGGFLGMGIGYSVYKTGVYTRKRFSNKSK